MKRIISISTFLLIFGLLTAIGVSLTAQAAPHLTSVCGPISANSTWTTIDSPYEVCSGGVSIPSSFTLTIQPGVTVQFQANALLTVTGGLVATGTPDQPIILTGVAAAPGSWAGILADNPAATPASINLSYVTLRYGGITSLVGAQIVLDHADLRMTHSILQDGAGNGIYATPNAHLEIQSTNFSTNAGSAMRLIQPVRDLNLNGLTAASNGSNSIFIGGTTYLHGQRTWPAGGLPYIIDGILGNSAGDSLNVEPGSELQFTANGDLLIGGDFKALGLPTAPITFTGQIKTAGSWTGLVLFGGQIPANAQLDYVTIEYGGRAAAGANITVDSGYLVAQHSTIRFSQKDGVRINQNGHASILNSQIVGNPLYGIRNTQISRPILATNDWWGAAAGPASDVTGCSPGTGDKVTAGVIFRPVLTDANAPQILPLSDAPAITMTPRRWFAPADSTTKVYFDIQLRDGNGTPMPGRQVRISASAGTPTDGGITDVNGRTLAFLISPTAGDVEVTAALDPISTCEWALSPTSKVTFTTPVNITDLFPDSPASYFDGRINISPLPVIVGVPATMQVSLKNPLAVPITVDATFGFAQTSIGLAFGPIHEFIGQVIPANSSVSLSAVWLPPISGHYCVQVSYTITAVGTTQVKPQAGGANTIQSNLEAVYGSVTHFFKKKALDAMHTTFNTLRELSPDAEMTVKSMALVGYVWILRKTGDQSEHIVLDPPRQDFTQLSKPVQYSYPVVQPSANISARRAAAINAINADMVEVLGNVEAAVIAMDRYGGASEAHDLTWAALQANANLFYQQQMGQALLRAADDLDAFVQVLVDENQPNLDVTTSEFAAYQQRLSTQGFTADEIAAAKLFDITDTDIENFRQYLIGADPNQMAGNLLDSFTDKAAAMRAAGQAVLTPDTFQPRYSVSGSAGLTVDLATGNTLAAVNNTEITIQIANPLSTPALIDMRTRRIDLPADWMVSVSPAQINLAPGQQASVTVSILSGSPVQQNSVPRLAVEAYATGTLLGGVVVDVVVPGYVPFDGSLHVYLPQVSK